MNARFKSKLIGAGVAVSLLIGIPVAAANGDGFSRQWVRGEVPDTVPAFVADIDNLGRFFCAESSAVGGPLDAAYVCESALDATALFRSPITGEVVLP